MVVAEEAACGHPARRGLQRLRGDLAAGAGAVLHHHRRAQLVLQLARPACGRWRRCRRRAESRRGCGRARRPGPARGRRRAVKRPGEQQAAQRLGSEEVSVAMRRSIAGPSSRRLTRVAGRGGTKARAPRPPARRSAAAAAPAAAPAARGPAAPSGACRPSRPASAPAAARRAPSAVSATETLRRLSAAGPRATRPRALQAAQHPQHRHLVEAQRARQAGLAQAGVRLQHGEHAELRRREAELAACVLEHGGGDLVRAAQQEAGAGVQAGQAGGRLGAAGTAVRVSGMRGLCLAGAPPIMVSMPTHRGRTP